MKKIRLDALMMDIKVPDSVSYVDDGVVDSIGAHENFLNWKRTGDPECLFDKTKLNDVAGTTYFQKGSGEYRFRIFYLDDSDPNSVICTRGHEETHFVHAVKRLDNLENEMRTSVGVDINFKNLLKKIDSKNARREIVAEIGGLFAVHRRYGSEAVKKYSMKYMSEFSHRSNPIYLKALNKL
jgi:hypothetical protein